jgi:hypothetical protein
MPSEINDSWVSIFESVTPTHYGGWDQQYVRDLPWYSDVFDIMADGINNMWETYPGTGMYLTLWWMGSTICERLTLVQGCIRHYGGWDQQYVRDLPWYRDIFDIMVDGINNMWETYPGTETYLTLWWMGSTICERLTLPGTGTYLTLWWMGLTTCERLTLVQGHIWHYGGWDQQYVRDLP